MEYIKTGAANTEYTGRIETMIEAVKHNEQARKEYRIMSAFEMDAREEGVQQGIQQGIRQGIEQGIEQGFSDGSYQAKLETAKLMRYENLGIDLISKVTGLSKEEIEAL